MKIICSLCKIQMYGTKIKDLYIYKCTSCGIKVELPEKQFIKVRLY